MYRHSHRYLDHTCSRDRTAHQQWCRWRLVLLVRLLLRMSEWNCARPQFFTAYYFADKVSLMSSVYTHRYDSVDLRRLGAMPLVVLSIENAWNNGTPAGARFNRSYSKVWTALHQGLARLSSRGVHRIVKGSSHQIELDKPQAVIDAVDQVLRELHTGAKP